MSPTISPTTAVTMGIPIATMVPNARLRMIIASTIPTSSLLSVSGLESSEPIAPPTAMSVMPASRSGREPTSRMRCDSSADRSADPMSSSTGMNAIRSSFESCAAPFWLNGLGALTTSGYFARAAAEALIAFL